MMEDYQNGINTSAMLPVGTLLQGNKYRIDRYLASGGFGNTYMATNVLFEEQVAIKEFYMRGVTERDGDTISVSVSNSENLNLFSVQKNKFMKEARRLRHLKNNHIVAVHDLFEENGTAYYVMDFISGESLSDRLKRTNMPLSEQEALNIVDQVLDALSVVHQQGIFHLDIKPANIMVDQRGCAMLIDFGASKQSKRDGGATTTTGLCYTIGYAPIEQMDQTEENMKSFGPWTDLYALGATLYKLVTNMTPPSASEILMNGTPLGFPTPVSARTRQLINWMMKPRMVERPQSVADVRHFLMAQPVVTHPNTQTASYTNTHVSSHATTQAAMSPKPQFNTVQQPQHIYAQNYAQKSSGSSKLPWILGVVFGLMMVFIVAVGAFVILHSSNKRKADVTTIENRSAGELNGTYNLSGSVHTYPVTMYLEVGDSRVSGYYYYNRSSNPSSLKLYGTRNGHRIELSETAPDGTPSGHFSGTLDDGVFSGEFINYQGKRMNFVVSRNGGY